MFWFYILKLTRKSPETTRFVLVTCDWLSSKRAVVIILHFPFLLFFFSIFLAFLPCGQLLSYSRPVDTVHRTTVANDRTTETYCPDAIGHVLATHIGGKRTRILDGSFTYVELMKHYSSSLDLDPDWHKDNLLVYTYICQPLVPLLNVNTVVDRFLRFCRLLNRRRCPLLSSIFLILDTATAPEEDADASSLCVLDIFMCDLSFDTFFFCLLLVQCDSRRKVSGIKRCRIDTRRWMSSLSSSAVGSIQ